MQTSKPTSFAKLENPKDRKDEGLKAFMVLENGHLHNKLGIGHRGRIGRQRMNEISYKLPSMVIYLTHRFRHDRHMIHQSQRFMNRNRLQSS